MLISVTCKIYTGEFYTGKLYTGKIYTRNILHRRILHQVNFTPGKFYTRPILHPANFTPGESYTRLILHPVKVTPDNCTLENFTPGEFYTGKTYTRPIVNRSQFQTDHVTCTCTYTYTHSIFTLYYLQNIFHDKRTFTSKCKAEFPLHIILTSIVTAVFVVSASILHHWKALEKQFHKIIDQILLVTERPRCL